MFRSLILHVVILCTLFMDISAHTSPLAANKRDHRARNSNATVKSKWDELQKRSLAECAELAGQRIAEGLVVCHKEIYGSPASQQIVDQLLVLFYSTNLDTASISSSLQLAWPNGDSLQTPPFILESSSFDLPTSSHTFNFLRDRSISSEESPIITLADQSEFALIHTPAETATIPSSLKSDVEFSRKQSQRIKKPLLRMQRRQEQESESLLLAPSTAARSRRPATSQPAQIDNGSALVVTVDPSSIQSTRGPRPRTSSSPAEQDAPASDSPSYLANPTPVPHVDVASTPQYQLGSGQTIPSEMLPYGLVAVVSILALGCLVVAFAAFSRRALRQEFREGKIVMAERQ